MITWPDEERRYRLDIGRIEELEEKCDKGSQEIFTALGDGSWRVKWVRETIRLGLIGGGLDPVRALGLTARYVVPGSLMVARGVAVRILYEALAGDVTDVVGKDEAGTEASPDASASRLSTEPGPSSDTPPNKSGNAHFGNSTPQ